MSFSIKVPVPLVRCKNHTRKWSGATQTQVQNFHVKVPISSSKAYHWPLFIWLHATPVHRITASAPTVPETGASLDLPCSPRLGSPPPLASHWACLSAGWGFSMGTEFQYHSWRVFVLVCALPTLLSLTGLMFMPESPRFLLEVRFVTWCNFYFPKTDGEIGWKSCSP